MGLSSEMKNLSDEMLASFKQRIKENEELVTDVQKTLDGFHKDHQEMAAILNANAKALRKDLNQGEKERLNTYRDLMTGIHSTISTIQQEVVAIQTSTFNMINEFTADRSQMADELNQTFAQNRAERMLDEKVRMIEFNALMKDINDDIKNINDEVAAIFKNTNGMLATFDKEHQEMSAELKAELSRNLAERVEYTRVLLNGFQKRLAEISKENQKMAQNLQKNLAKGEVERINEYNGVMKGIHAAIKGIQKEVKEVQKATSGMLNNYANDREGAAAEWNKMQAAIAKIRKTGVVEPPKAVEKKEVKPTPVAAVEETPVAIVEEIPVALVEEAPVEAQPKEEPKPVVPLTLEGKVLDYINKHPNGVKISEMEGSFGETRMKLGFVAKALLEEGKVQKLENIYFPIK
jgi:ABC-type transporter Mla subunit MlaD